ncbi:hypothetical protein INT45_004687 [Circinella minor]|uniref:F-box domain-containing protein n=1 Tax=Circinella minor TaxID=1195481 RepID=A0A8H7VM16_9FUNG|nr:hypothetical protein INT45_004687 [Circinella minor]
MSQLTRLPNNILIRISNYLRLGDLVTLQSADANLEDFLHRYPEVWTTNLFFPPNDMTITDGFIRHNVPKIPRSYALREIKLVNLPLTWAGFLWVFDHFAHSVDRIHVKASEQTLTDLARHLSIFAGNLAVLQHENKIPITFRQYAINHSEYENTLWIHQQTDDYNNRISAIENNSRYSISNIGRDNNNNSTTLKNLRRYLETLRLDDPPFEQLAELYVECTDQSPTVSVDTHENNPIHQIYFVTSFLSGGHDFYRHRQLGNNKRSREEEEDGGSSTTINNSMNNNGASSSTSSSLRESKCRRQDNPSNNNSNTSTNTYTMATTTIASHSTLPASSSPPTTTAASSLHHTPSQPPLGYT